MLRGRSEGGACRRRQSSEGPHGTPALVIVVERRFIVSWSTLAQIWIGAAYVCTEDPIVGGVVVGGVVVQLVFTARYRSEARTLARSVAVEMDNCGAVGGRNSDVVNIGYGEARS